MNAHIKVPLWNTVRVKLTNGFRLGNKVWMHFTFPIINDFFHRCENISVLFSYFILISICLNGHHPNSLPVPSPYAQKSINTWPLLYTQNGICSVKLTLNWVFKCFIHIHTSSLSSLMHFIAGLEFKLFDSYYISQLYHCPGLHSNLLDCGLNRVHLSDVIWQEIFLVSVEQWCNSPLFLSLRKHWVA